MLVPVLPVQYVDMLHSVVPFLFGMQACVFACVSPTRLANVTVVDLQADAVRNGMSLADLPVALQRLLPPMTRLRAYKQYLSYMRALFVRSMVEAVRMSVYCFDL